MVQWVSRWLFALWQEPVCVVANATAKIRAGLYDSHAQDGLEQRIWRTCHDTLRDRFSLLLLVTGYPRAIPVATYYTEEACKEAITKIIAHPQKEFKLECHEDVKL